MKSKEEILAKRIIRFPAGDRRLAAGAMTDEAIKRNVYAAMEEYAAQFKDSPYQGSAGVWVKASERLPEIRKAVPVKIDGDYGVGNFADNRNGDIRFWHNGKNEWFMPQSFPYIFWLDSAASPAGGGEAIEILKELCWLKSHKDNVGKDSVYRQRQPEAWKRANEFLNSLVKTGKP